MHNNFLSVKKEKVTFLLKGRESVNLIKIVNFSDYSVDLIINSKMIKKFIIYCHTYCRKHNLKKELPHIAHMLKNP
jgi:hypothetical protein